MEEKADWPKGCHFAEQIYFNPHSTGSNKNNSRQICKRKDKFFGLYLFNYCYKR